MNLIDLIPFDRYITLDELESATGMNRRTIRDEMHKLRTKSPETLIISSSSKKGYKRPSSYDELLACRNESIKRIRAERKKIQILDIVINNKGQRGLGI